MADVFISYKSERRPAARHLAETLIRHGFSVWYDYQLVKGRNFGRQIDAEIRVSKAVVVLWCGRSVNSEWVHEEVDLAKDLGILVPAKIEACELPVGNRLMDYVNLTSWDGSPRSHALDPLLDAIGRLVGRDPAPQYAALRDYEAAWRSFGALPLARLGIEQPLETGDGTRHLPSARQQHPPVVSATGNVFTKPSVTVNQTPLRGAQSAAPSAVAAVTPVEAGFQPNARPTGDGSSKWQGDVATRKAALIQAFANKFLNHSGDAVHIPWGLATFTVGADELVDGIIAIDGEVIVAGTARGAIIARNVIIQPMGKLVGTALGRSLDIAGNCSGGPIMGGRIVCRSTAYVEADLHFEELALEQGLYFEGKARRKRDGIWRSELPAFLATLSDGIG